MNVPGFDLGFVDDTRVPDKHLSRGQQLQILCSSMAHSRSSAGGSNNMSNQNLHLNEFIILSSNESSFQDGIQIRDHAQGLKFASINSETYSGVDFLPNNFTTNEFLPINSSSPNESFYNNFVPLSPLSILQKKQLPVADSPTLQYITPKKLLDSFEKRLPKRQRSNEDADINGNQKKKLKAQLDPRVFEHYSERQAQEFERTRYDFICGVPTARRKECRRNIGCKAHSFETKSKILRSKPLSTLLIEDEKNSKETRLRRVQMKKYFSLKEKYIAFKVDSPKEDPHHPYVKKWISSSLNTSIAPSITKTSTPILSQTQLPEATSEQYRLLPNKGTLSEPPKQIKGDKMKDFTKNLAQSSNEKSATVVAFLHLKLKPLQNVSVDERCIDLFNNFAANLQKKTKNLK